MSTPRRRTATALLSQFASHLRPQANAFTIPWDRITTDQIHDTIEALQPELSLRKLNAMRNCVDLVVKKAAEPRNSTPVPKTDRRIPNISRSVTFLKCSTASLAQVCV
jgi:hypothetical protein